MAGHEAFSQATESEGILRGGGARADRRRKVGSATATMLTDGPYAETREQLGGFYIGVRRPRPGGRGRQRPRGGARGGGGAADHGFD